MIEEAVRGLFPMGVEEGIIFEEPLGSWAGWVGEGGERVEKG